MDIFILENRGVNIILIFEMGLDVWINKNIDNRKTGINKVKKIFQGSGVIYWLGEMAAK